MATLPTEAQQPPPGHVINLMRTAPNDSKALERAAAEKESCFSLQEDTSLEVPLFSGGGTGSQVEPMIDASDVKAAVRVRYMDPAVMSLTEDITAIKTQAAADIADGGVVATTEGSGYIIETFCVNDQSVAKFTLTDTDAKEGRRPYSSLEFHQQHEDYLTSAMGRGKPPLEVEQWIAAMIILALGGETGARPHGYWAKARDLAQQQLWLIPGLETTARHLIHLASLNNTIASTDPNLFAMVGIVRKCLPTPAFNPYYQAARDSFAVAVGFYQRLDQDIFMALDKNGEVIAFVIKDAFRDLVGIRKQMRITQALDSYSSLQPVPAPDKTRHALHWANWLGRLRPDLDRRHPLADPHAAKSGTYHIGVQSPTASPDGRYEPCELLDLAYQGSEERAKELHYVRHNTLGTTTVVADFYLNLVDAELRKEYVRVTETVEKKHHRGKNLKFKTRLGDEPFALRAIGINTKRYEQEDAETEGAWEHGLTAYATFGHFQGGDLLLRELGIQVACPPLSIQILRSRELRHSTTPYQGKRIEISHQTPEGVRRWARNHMSEEPELGDGFPWNVGLDCEEPGRSKALEWTQPQNGDDQSKSDGDPGPSSRPLAPPVFRAPAPNFDSLEPVYEPAAPYAYPQAFASTSASSQWSHDEELENPRPAPEQQDAEWDYEAELAREAAAMARAREWQGLCEYNPTDPNEIPASLQSSSCGEGILEA
ncbi:hypothetical protein F4818DRAFT_22119 [Hypoxylon cercidicola]|nr:hypothetical protein F4818DRAFT_22119 [Hypoxylon cercidicola]